uniref:Uncharacterized protein n=1 Tax=Cajanus cajan TaxID=3821 RepID=A0A151SLB1_CAJCA|nr:hypothetical protein KK1_001803 [Cajanus cajan]
MSAKPDASGIVISSKSQNPRRALLLLLLLLLSSSSATLTSLLLASQSATACELPQLSSAATATAASAATRRISLALVDAGSGSRQAESAKLRHANLPRSASAATSCARAAISGVGYVPSQILVDLSLGTRTSHTHLLLFLRRTPRYTGCLVSLKIRRPARFLGRADANA